MKIRFQSRHGVQQVEIRSVTGGHEYASWRNNEEREVGENETLMMRVGDRVVRKNAIRALLECGPDFVDASTGLNPMHTCKKCGIEALDVHFLDRQTLKLVEIADASGNRLCLAHWLADHPEYILHHRQMGLPEEILHQAETYRAEAQLTKDVSLPRIAEPQPPAAETQEEPHDAHHDDFEGGA